MKSFSFKGSVEASKSLMNRALILQAQYPQLEIEGQSSSDDVLHLQKALQTTGSEFFVGEGGTTFRFLAIMLSKRPGIWKLRGSERLFSRPLDPLLDLFRQLNVSATFDQNSLNLHSSGWKLPDQITIDLSKSSQFASGFLLCCWDMEKPIQIQFSENRVSDGYLEMTLQLLSSVGFEYKKTESGISVSKLQKLKASKVTVEQDISSAFAVAALAAIRGSCDLYPFDLKSLQPDVAFVEIFKKIGIPTDLVNGHLKISRSSQWNPVKVSLNNCPDLFPVLCVLLSKCDGVSEIFDTPQLVYKESNRLAKISELLSLMQVKHQVLEGGIRITGKKYHHHQFFLYQPDHDHRLAFAAAVAKSMGYRLRITNPEVVNKSFPGFWNLISGGAG